MVSSRLKVGFYHSKWACPNVLIHRLLLLSISFIYPFIFLFLYLCTLKLYPQKIILLREFFMMSGESHTLFSWGIPDQQIVLCLWLRLMLLAQPESQKLEYVNEAFSMVPDPIVGWLNFLFQHRKNWLWAKQHCRHTLICLRLLYSCCYLDHSFTPTSKVASSPAIFCRAHYFYLSQITCV